MGKYILVQGIKVRNDFTPETFGRLTSIGPKFLLSVPYMTDRMQYQVFRCECGNELVVPFPRVRTGETRSCGCLHKDQLRERAFIHGSTRNRKVTPEYEAWRGVITRCEDKNKPQYPDYGGRGITVCDRWREPNGQGFINFLDDMGERPSKGHSIDRKDNNGNYEPANCRWATRSEQAQNKRNTRNLEAFGKTQCLSVWAREYGMSAGVLCNRLKRGMSIEEALTKPLRPTGR